MKHLDLFCGPGGFATGFSWSGFSSVLGVDIHAPSLKTFARNHPEAKTLLGDIRAISAVELKDLAQEENIQLISAGVPCEGFSMANRNRTKWTDERNFLFREFLRISEAFLPPYVLVENVANLARHDGGRFADDIEMGIQSLGYRTSSTILDAQNYGVPQRRRRVMFIGALPGFEFTWPAPSHGAGLLPIVSVGEAILGDLPALGSGEESSEYSGPPVTHYQKLMRGNQKELLNHEAPSHPPETIRRIAGTAPGMPMYEKYKQRIRLHPDRPSPTVVSGGVRPQFAYGHPTQPRGLTIRERARLMSFPDDYEFLGGLVQGRVQTGDAVPPLLAKAIGEQISRGLKGEIDESKSELGKLHVRNMPARLF